MRRLERYRAAYLEEVWHCLKAFTLAVACTTPLLVGQLNVYFFYAYPVMFIFGLPTILLFALPLAITRSLGLRVLVLMLAIAAHVVLLQGSLREAPNAYMGILMGELFLLFAVFYLLLKRKLRAPAEPAEEGWKPGQS